MDRSEKTMHVRAAEALVAKLEGKTLLREDANGRLYKGKAGGAELTILIGPGNATVRVVVTKTACAC